MKEQADRANDFIDFIAKSPTKYHAINNIKSKLLKHNFIPLSFDNKWELSPSGKYFITRVRDKDCVKNRVKRAKIVRFTLC